MEYSQRFYSMVKDYLIKDDVRFSENAERGSFTVNYGLGEEAVISGVCMHFLVHADGISLLTVLDGIKALPKTKMVVSSAINIINYGLRYGCFEMDDSDGEVQFRFSNNIPVNSALDYEYMDHLVVLSLLMAKRYSVGLVPAMLGYITDPAEAVQKCEDDD